MKLSFSTLACPRWSWDEIVSTASDLGYDGIEIRGVGNDISITSIPEFNDKKIQETLSRLKKLNISIPCLDSDCCIHQKNNQENTFKEIKAYIELAKKMNVPYIRVMPSDPVPHPSGDIDEIFVKEQAQIMGDMAKESNITILLETHGIWAKSEKMAKLMQEISHNNIGVLWDIHHPFRFMKETPKETYNNLKQYVKHIHIKDGYPTENNGYKYAMPGLGDIPIEQCVQLLMADNYKGYFSLEWVKRWDMTLEEPGIVLAHYINYMKSI